MQPVSRNILIRAACDGGCLPCYRDCAVVGVKLNWWRGEQERLLRERPARSSPRYPDWLADIREAQGAVARLTQARRAVRPDPGDALPTRRLEAALRLVSSGPGTGGRPAAIDSAKTG